jgi:putative transposase
MTRKQYTPLALEVKELLGADRDFLLPLVQSVVQEILEAEMDGCLQAGKHERTAERLGYRSG